MWIPRRLYEALPAFYILIGLVGIFVPQTAGRVCGIVLLFASYQIIHMRRKYRKARDVSSNYDVE